MSVPEKHPAEGAGVVLWVDDDPLHTSRFSPRLGDAGLTVVECGSVECALEAFADGPFDGVVLDLLMPEGPFSAAETAGGHLTGLVLARRFRGTHPGLPVVIMSATESADAAAWCSQNPPAAFRLKPALDAMSAAELRRLLERGDDALVDELITLLCRVGSVASSLRKRHDSRPTLLVADEYDLQDLVHAVLQTRYDDVRPEDASPSHAGRNARVDFVLPDLRTAIELKMVGRSFNTARLGEQLLVDIARYRRHPDVSDLVCFVADPHRRVPNPIGLARDLEQHSDADLGVRVVIYDSSGLVP